MLKLDHIVLAAETLQEGVDYVPHRLGVSFDAGGQHDLFGTHNRLLDWVIVIFDRALTIAGKPTQRPLWFDLEHFAGPPRVITWLCQTREMGQTLSALPYDPGQVITVTRDDLDMGSYGCRGWSPGDGWCSPFAHRLENNYTPDT